MVDTLSITGRRFAVAVPPVDPVGNAQHCPQVLEQANIESGLRWLARHRGDVLTDDFVVTLHKRLFGDVWEWACSFRRTGKNIGIDPLHISVELRTLMDDARYWAEHATYDPIESAVRLHHRLVFIHPFPNGNGRHARIMADTVLRRIFRLDPIDWAMTCRE
jgi:Fic-DOC domain mobile mystery protein B